MYIRFLKQKVLFFENIRGQRYIFLQKILLLQNEKRISYHIIISIT